jgi:F-type H+-transporting ATPase subunit delta
MPITNNFSPLVLSYAQALLELAGDQAESIGDETAQLQQVIETNPTFAAFLADPSIGEAERGAVLERTFKGRVSPLLWNFLGVLNTKDRLGSFIQMAEAYHHLLDQKLGNVEVDLTVAQPLSDDQIQNAQQKISAALGKKALIRSHTDDSIIGGVIVRVGDQLLDASVRYQLQAMKEQLLAKIPK